MAHLKVGGANLFYQLTLLDEQTHADENGVVNLSTALKWQESRVKFCRTALHYRDTVLHSNQSVNLSKGGRTMWLPGRQSLINQIKYATKIVRVLRQVVEQFGSERISAGGLSDSNFNAHPEGVKTKTRYSLCGVFMWDKCFQFRPEREEYFGRNFIVIQMHSDKTGYWFVDNGRKNYIITHRSTDEEEEATVPTDPTDTTTDPIPGSSKQLLPKKGHGLSRLLAEAIDPPGIQVSGSYESLKGFRRRLLARPRQTYKDVTSIFKWESDSSDPDGPSSCIVTFESEELRERFVQEQPIPAGLILRPVSIY
ncbi:E2 protein [Papillomaviridae sp. Haddock_c145]|nr:E2 protein [Papillomaviridae sp. Haddock_c145]